MIGFEEFAELLERICFNSWRSALGKDNDALISEISTIAFSKEDIGGKWRFSFALRRFGRWAQAQREISPIEYDPYDPPPIDVYESGKSQSPQNIASQLAIEMLQQIADVLGA